MNTNPEFKNLFKSWSPRVDLPSRFRPDVWRRIEERKATHSNTLWAKLGELVATAFARPRYAIPTLALFVGVASFLGIMQGEQYAARAQAKYVLSIDPYAQALQKK